MNKKYRFVKVMLIFALLFTQKQLQAQKCCVECQADVKSVSDKQVLLEKIDIKEGTLATNVSTNIYVSYRSGNAQKFWANVAIATAGVAVSTQLNSNTNTSEGKTASAISPIVPLGISAATLPSIWKNRPRGIPQAGLYIQHRDLRGKLLNTWEQPISKEAKNSAELLTVNIEKPLSAGTLEVYLQNGSKNEVYFWGLQTLKDVAKVGKIHKSVKPNEPIVNDKVDCPDGDCGTKTNVEHIKETLPTTTTTRSTNSTHECIITETCVYWRERDVYSDGTTSDWEYYSNCSSTSSGCGGYDSGTAMNGGSSSSSGTSLDPIGFKNIITKLNRPERRSESYMTKCAGLRAMWEYSYRNNSPVTTKEMGGLLTTNGKLIILPSYDNVATHVSWKNTYYDENGRESVIIYKQNGKIMVDQLLYQSNGQIGDTITDEVEAMIHTHPFTNSNAYDIFNASPDDMNVANLYPEIKHFALTQSSLVEFDSTNKQKSLNNHNCP
jgi:hypothetical protein